MRNTPFRVTLPRVFRPQLSRNYPFPSRCSSPFQPVPTRRVPPPNEVSFEALWPTTTKASQVQRMPSIVIILIPDDSRWRYRAGYRERRGGCQCFIKKCPGLRDVRLLRVSLFDTLRPSYWFEILDFDIVAVDVLVHPMLESEDALPYPEEEYHL